MKARRFFQTIVNRPRLFVALGVATVAVTIGLLPRLTRDTSSDAFIPAGDPVLIFRDQVEETFGLKDPMVVAVVDDRTEAGVFTPHTLELIAWLSEELTAIEGIDPERITSLATENDIIGTEDGMLVEPFFESPPQTQAEANAVRAAVMDFDLYMGSLVARDGSATLIVAEMLPDIGPNQAADVYRDIMALVERAPVDGEAVHVAGEGAVSGYLATYIDADARRLNPIAALIITLVLFVAYRTWRGVILPNFLVLAAVGTAIGGMAAAGVPFYVITNGLPVILIAIAVADGIHILAEYYDQLEEDPSATQQELVVRAMQKMWRPVTFTSITTASGFLGLWAASYMPPMKAFGLFAAAGVMAAWAFAMLVIPAGLALVRVRPSPAYRAGSDRFSGLMGRIGGWVIARPKSVLVTAGVVVVLGVIGATRLEVNEETVANFNASEPIYQADRAINQRLDGTYYLDVVVESPDIEGLFDPQHLRRIEELQEYLETLPHVGGTTSIADFLKQMNMAMHEDQTAEYRLPVDPDLIAQYFLLYSASGDPTDFEEYIDYDYRVANVRARLNTGVYTDEKVVIDAARSYIAENFSTSELTAAVSGRVAVDDRWIGELGKSHFRGVAVALVVVWLVASMSFRSILAGTLAIVPVSMSVLLIYAAMALFDVWLGVGTSMFAAIAIGVGVDFAVHTIDRLLLLVKEEGHSLTRALQILFPSTGRALLFNFAALLFGFGALITSSVPPLVHFGALIGVSVAASFIASMTVLPAVVYLVRPAFLRPDTAPERTRLAAGAITDPGLAEA
ncbi:MAG: MMPL family transporter [Gemmatimonadetes bacterium]|nr:MMPL family transporter [Gemmatimonadota bacterium]